MTARPGGERRVETRVLSSERIWAAMAFPSMSLDTLGAAGSGVVSVVSALMAMEEAGLKERVGVKAAVRRVRQQVNRPREKSRTVLIFEMWILGQKTNRENKNKCW